MKSFTKWTIEKTAPSLEGIMLGKESYTPHEVRRLLHQAVLRERFRSICPYDAKYRDEEINDCLSMEAEVKYCGKVHEAVLAGLHRFGREGMQPSLEALDDLSQAIKKLGAAYVVYLEDAVTKHDQQAIIGAITENLSDPRNSRYIHPGLTSYDILDSARSLAFRDAVAGVLLPRSKRLLMEILDSAERWAGLVQVGRTHGQWTSPVTVGYVLAGYGQRLADRIRELDRAKDKLQGKLDGIVGTGAQPALFVREGEFENYRSYVLNNILGLKVCRTPTQIVPKEPLSDLGHCCATMDLVLADAANSLRQLKRPEIREFLGVDTQGRLGGSSTDAGKDNPITEENISGLCEDIVAGMLTLYRMPVSEHQRDLRGSVQSRFEPQHMMAGLAKSLKDMTRVMANLAAVPQYLEKNLGLASMYSSEAMNVILKSHAFADAHKRVKEWTKEAKRSDYSEMSHNPFKYAIDRAFLLLRGPNRRQRAEWAPGALQNFILKYEKTPKNTPLLDTAMKDPDFSEYYWRKFSSDERLILSDPGAFTGYAVPRTRETVQMLRQEFSQLP